MSFDWSNFVVLADELRTLNCRGGVEARLRSSISRGYYGVFHLLRLRLQKEGLKFSGNVETHQEIVQALRTSPDRRRFGLGVDIGRLRNYRNRADYEDQISNVAQMEGEVAMLRESLLRKIAAMNGSDQGE